METSNREPADSASVIAETSEDNGVNDERINQLSNDQIISLLIRLDGKMDRISAEVRNIKQNVLEPLKIQVNNIEEVVDKNFDAAFNKIEGLDHKITDLENGLLHEQYVREEMHAQITVEFTNERQRMNTIANELRGELWEVWILT
jgi:hypothetical protein